jgi:hypothetical protein
MIEQKIKILTDLGFVPMVEGKGNTLFRMNDVVMSVSDPNQTPEQLKKEVMSLIKNRDIAERGGQVPVVEEPAPEPEQAQKEEPEAPAEEAAPNPGEEDSNPFTENQETLEPFYICDELKKIETPKFVRLTLDGNRFYVRKMDDGTAKIYASVTTMIRDGFVDDKTALQEWRQEMRMIGRNPEEVSEYDADKGTIMHYLYGLYLTGRDMVLNRSFIVKTVQEGKLKISKKNLDKFFGSIDDLDDMIVRVMKFAKFCSEYKVKPMMIERILSLEDYLVATPIDAMVKMTFKYKEEGYFGAVYQRATGQFKKGDPKKEVREVEKEEIVILDFKSGDIRNEHAFQLEAERRMVKNWYGIDARIMNFSPKSTNSKGYTLKEWSDKNAAMEKADCVFQQGMLNHIRKDKRFKVRKGVLNINKPYNEEDHTVVYDIAEEMSKRFII